jgi:hypothetical protein
VVLDLSTIKRLDDIKAPFLDKPPVTDLAKGPADDLGAVDPRVPLSRPLVLSTPHHADVSHLGGAEAAGSDQPSQAEYAALLAQLGDAVAEQQQMLQELAERYDAVRAEYEQLFGQAPA